MSFVPINRSQQVGVANIRDFEDTRMKAAQQHLDRKLEVANQVRHSSFC